VVRCTIWRMVEEARPVPLSYRMTEIKPERFAFDFEAHRKAAVEKYNRKRDSYREFAETIHDILADAIRTRDLRVNEIQMRAKTVDSFGKKAMTPKKENSDEPKYKDPLAEITTSEHCACSEGHDLNHFCRS
jgi:hypothetical protein